MRALLPVHIVAGGLAIILGGVALLAPKGRTVHRTRRILFCISMLTKVISASFLTLGHDMRKGIDPNVFAGFTVTYFVGTSLMAVRPASTWSHRLNWTAMIVTFALALLGYMQGMRALA